MSVMTYEGIVEKGQIRLKGKVQLPEKARVFIVVPDSPVRKSARIFSPRLKHPEQVVDFVLEIVEESSNAGI